MEDLSTLGLRALLYGLPCAASLWIYLKQFRRRKGEPPMVYGWPLLGSVIPFGKHSGKFLQKQREKHGDIFTVYIAGKRMHFLAGVHSLKQFFRSPALSFDKVAEAIAQNAFGYPDPIKNHPDHNPKDLKRFYMLLQGKDLQELTGKFQAALAPALGRRPPPAAAAATAAAAGAPRGRDQGLYAWTYQAVFEAATAALYGEGFGREEVRAAFEGLDAWFPLLAAQVPGGVLPGVRGRRALLADRLARNLRENYEQNAALARARDDYFAEHGFRRHDREHMHVVMLWAALANTIPAAFWALAQVVANPTARAKVMEELSALAAELENTASTATSSKEEGREGGGGFSFWPSRRGEASSSPANAGQGSKELNKDQKAASVPVVPEFTWEQVGRMVVLEGCVHEALRLASSSLVLREVQEPTLFEVGEGGGGGGGGGKGGRAGAGRPSSSYRLRRGDFLVVSPYLNHMDPELFGPQPEAFRWDRFLEPAEEELAGEEPAGEGRGGRRGQGGGGAPRPPRYRARRGFGPGGRTAAAAALMPFGGGSTMCPGRHLAVAEVKLFVAHALLRWPALALGGDLGALEADQGRSGLGILPPKGDIPFFCGVASAGTATPGEKGLVEKRN